MNNSEDGNEKGREAGGYYRTSRPGEKGDDDIVHQQSIAVYIFIVHCFVPMILAEPVGEVAADPTTTSTA